MSEDILSCAQCGGDLVEGYVLDETHTGAMPAEWVEGSPEMTGLSGVKVKGKNRHFVTAYRCSECGRLELYA